MSELARRIADLPPDQRLALAIRLASRRANEAVLDGTERESGDFPLSYAQERLWFLDQLSPGNPSYNLSFAHALGFAVDHEALTHALSALVARHESLRTSFPMVDDEPVQRVAAARPVTCPVVDLQYLPPRRRRAETKRLADSLATEPFDLATGPLFRCALVRVGEPGDVFVLVIHHIVADGWSLEIIFRELETLYGDRVTNTPPSLPPPGPQYADFTLWQRRRLTGPNVERLVDYWRGALDGAATLDLPTDRPRPSLQSFRGAEVRFDVDRATVDELREIGRRADATPFMVLLAAFTAVLHAHTGQDDIVVGTPIASRTNAELEGIVGFFANSLVLRNDLSGNPTFMEFVRRTRAMTMDAFDHQELPFSKLVSALMPGQDLSRNPLFQVSFQLLSSHVAEAGGRASGPTDAEIRLERGTAIFDLALNLVEWGPSVRGQFEYNTDLFDAATIEALRDHFLTLLGNAARTPDAPIGDLAILTPPEVQQLEAWGAGPVVPPDPADVIAMFQGQRARTPDALAVSDGVDALSYAELDEQANQLADLISERVGRGRTVGVMMRPTVRLATAILAVLKSGCAFVPIDPATPGSRMAGMIRDATVTLVLTDPGLDGSAPPQPALGVDVLVVSLASGDGQRGARRRPSRPVDPATPAYVMFTSGSTGRPKGVVVSHRSLANYVHWCATTYPLDAGDGAPLASSIASDMALTSLFVPLVTGKAVFFLDDSDIVEALDSALRRDTTFSFVKLTPSHLHALRNLSVGREVPSNTKAFVVGGEALRGETLAPWRSAAPELLVWNEYGPTEATVACCAHQAAIGTVDDGPVPIGHPLPNTTLDVLDTHGRLVPVGVVGELHIGGVGLAEGYLGEAELTASRFPEHPARRYRSGDLVRRRRNGQLDYVGRVDRQLKIRGHRVEPGEIESVLNRHPGVVASLVVARDLGHDDRRLVAHVVSADGDASEDLASELAALARRELPAPMVPSRFVLVASLPVTAAGKADVRALEALDEAAGRPGGAGRVATAPRTSLERIAVTVFADVLVADGRVGVHDDFFTDCGGDSLLATKAVARLREYLSSDIPLRLLFEHPTAAGLADALVPDLGDAAVLEERARLVLEVLELTDDEADAELEAGAGDER